MSDETHKGHPQEALRDDRAYLDHLARDLENIDKIRARSKSQGISGNTARTEAMLALGATIHFVEQSGIPKRLTVPLHELFIELQDADRGTQPGPITRPTLLTASRENRPPDSTSEWSKRVAAAAAMHLLHNVGKLKLREAAGQAGRIFNEKPARVKQWRKNIMANRKTPDTAALGIWEAAIDLGRMIDATSPTKLAEVQKLCDHLRK